MQQIRSFIVRSPWARAGVVAAILAALVWALLPSDMRTSANLKMAYWIGAFAPAILIGLGVGFVSMNKTWWFWSTVILLIGTLIILGQTV